MLDECVPKDVCKALPNHECWTVAKAGFAGKENGELLRLAERAKFDVLLTIDQGFEHQQNLAERTIAIILIRSRSNKLADVLPHMEACNRALGVVEPGRLIRING